MGVLAQANSASGTSILRAVIEGLLDQTGQQLGPDLSSQEKIPKLVRMVNELSLPLCQLEMQLLLQSSPAGPKDKANEGTGSGSATSIEMATSLFEAIMRSPDSERPPWLDLVDGLDPALLNRLRAIAEMQVLKMVNECCAHVKGDVAGAAKGMDP